MSPYHMPLEMGSTKPITDMLLCVDEDNKAKYHTRKMVARIREVAALDPMYCFYREFSEKMYTEEQIHAEMVSFLINSLLFNK